jgi:hypothetical protein
VCSGFALERLGRTVNDLLVSTEKLRSKSDGRADSGERCLHLAQDLKGTLRLAESGIAT